MDYIEIAEKMLGVPSDVPLNGRLARMLHLAGERVRRVNDDHAALRSTQVMAAIIAVWEATA